MWLESVLSISIPKKVKDMTGPATFSLSLKTSAAFVQMDWASVNGPNPSA